MSNDNAAGFAVIAAKIDELPIMESLAINGADAATRFRGVRNARNLRLFIAGALDAMSFEDFKEFHAFRVGQGGVVY